MMKGVRILGGILVSVKGLLMLKLETSWHLALKDELAQPYIAELKEFLSCERAAGSSVYPPEDKVFNAFRHTPFDQVKVVIMGQDPYHVPGQAHGLSFSVERDMRIPPSLRNIYKELGTDMGFEVPEHGNLMAWARQGVLMLNATLTVREGEPKSHYGRGWERFTDAVITKLCDRKDPIVFLLWGRSAQEKCSRILSVKDHPHAVLTSAHPSPFSAHMFLGCRHFSQANQFLKKWNKTPITWSLE